ncbi:MAG: twin transmembrane helix small protein [Gammaproteobacteria bacterium]|nr:twin transmembrane helix small protein [Gammaproteobacteria bacterium]
MPIKLFVLIILIAILTSLGSALFYLVKDQGTSKRTVKALTFRIGLSLALFIMLLVAYATGIIQPHGLIV